MGAAGIKFTNQFVVTLHPSRAGGERFTGIHARDHGKRILALAGRTKFHQRATGVDQRNVRADASEGNRRPFMNLDAQAIRHESHDARRFHPRNLFQLQFALGKGNEKNVAADIFAHHFHDVRVRDVLSAANFDLIAGIDAKTPRALSVTVEAQAGGSENRKSKERHGDSLQPIGSLLRNGSAPDRDSLLSAQKWGFLLRFQIDEPRVVEGLTLESPMLRNIAGKRIQLFLYRAGT